MIFTIIQRRFTNTTMNVMIFSISKGLPSTLLSESLDQSMNRGPLNYFETVVYRT